MYIFLRNMILFEWVLMDDLHRRILSGEPRWTRNTRLFKRKCNVLLIVPPQVPV
jgi:hypothetical protein